jgi:hypothetical protein
MPLRQAGAEQHHMPINFHARLCFGFFHFSRINITKVWNVSHVKTNRFTHEHFQRHFINRGAIWVHMTKSVNMRSDMVKHANKVSLKSHCIAGNSEIE